MGVYGADAYLCHVGRSIASALLTVAAKAEAARADLRSSHATLRAALLSRYNELEAHINAAESAKIVALERELCAVDSALEAGGPSGALQARPQPPLMTLSSRRGTLS